MTYLRCCYGPEDRSKRDIRQRAYQKLGDKYVDYLKQYDDEEDKETNLQKTDPNGSPGTKKTNGVD